MNFFIEERIHVISDEIQIYAKMIGSSRGLLIIHSIGYLIINFSLFLVNFLFYRNNYQFWPWVILGWGIFYFFHLYLYLMNGIRTYFGVHLYFFLFMSLFLAFIDGYSDMSFEWFYYVIIGWFVLLAIHKFLFAEKIEEQLKGVIYALLISDNSSRTLIQVVQKKDVLLEKVGMSDEQVEFIPMFITALNSFCENLQLQSPKINVSDPNLKILTLQYRDLTLTGFVSPNMNPTLSYIKFKSILQKLYQEREKQIKVFLTTGRGEMFDSYIPTLQEEMLIPV